MSAQGTPDTARELARNAEERSNLYGFLATIHRAEPTPELLRRIRDENVLASLKDAGVRFEPGYLDRPPEELADDLAVEYTRLFIGPGKHIPPYESVQREGTLCGQAASETVAFVRRCGFAYDPDYHGLPDHISVELELMQELTRREALAWAEGDEAEARRCLQIERDFLHQHLAGWTPAFCERVLAETDSPFYRELAALTRDFIETEHQDVTRRVGNGADPSPH
ncbi:MAG: molecular chaperone TorD family protein [Kiloniellales bacterium]